MLKKNVFGSLNLNISEIFRLSFEDIFLGTLNTYTKKMNPPSAVLGGGGVHGKVCWLIACYSFVHNKNFLLVTFSLISDTPKKMLLIYLHLTYRFALPKNHGFA